MKWVKQHFYIKRFLLVCYIRCAKTVVTLSFPKAKIDWYKCVEPQKKLALLNMQIILKKRKACNIYFLPKLFYDHQPSGHRDVNSTTCGLHSRCFMFVQFTSYVPREIMYFDCYFMNLRNVLEIVVNYVLRLENEEMIHKISLPLSLPLSLSVSLLLWNFYQFKC